MRRRDVKRLFRFPSRTSTQIRDDVRDEFAFHLESRTEALVDAGASVDDARAQAIREFGDAQRGLTMAVRHQERLERRHRIGHWFDELRQDLRHAWRSLLRTPGFAATAVLILALGLGATTAVFSVLSTVLLHPLPYPDADRLVDVWGTRGGSGAVREPIALPDYRAMRDGNRSFAALGAFSGSGFIITGGDRAEFVHATMMTASMWRVLGARPMLGRTFSESEELWGRNRVVVIGEGLWQRRFGADPHIIGTTMRIGPQALTIVGVMPASFHIIGIDAEMWVPMSFPPDSVMDSRRNRFASVLGRLQEGTSVGQGREDLTVIAARLAQQDPQFNAGLGVDIGSWQEGIVGSARSTLILLFGAAILVLLVACANLANLLLARATTREHEWHTRAILGAGRARVMRLVLIETCLLVAVGGVAGAALLFALLRAIPRLGPIGLPRLSEISVDGTVLAFAAGLMVLTALLFGLWPSRRAARAAVGNRRRSAARTIASGRMEQRSRRLLIVAEVSMSLVLLIGATLLILSLQRLQQVNAGFNAERLFTAMVIRNRPDGRDVFVQQLVDRVAAIPGVRAAAATTSLPLVLGAWGKNFNADGQPPPASIADVPNVSFHHITPEYFRTMQAAMRRGRAFTARDRADQPLVAIVNETLARRVWPDTDPLGKRISMFPPEQLATNLLPLPDGSTTFPRLTVVGVVADFRQAGLDQAPSPSVFVPLAQGSRAGGGDQIQGFHYVVARTVGDPLSIGAAVADAVRETDRNAAVSDVRTMESRLSDSIARRRFAMILLGAFAFLALALAVVGLYGVMSYTVNQRRQELGVRAAVGASTANLLCLVMADGLRMTVVGVGLGLGLAVSLSDIIAAQLYEVQAVDLHVYAGITTVLLLVAALACGIPAVRAAGVDPVAALRAE